ncbi:unnamed protein product [Discula destructiva]
MENVSPGDTYVVESEGCQVVCDRHAVDRQSEPINQVDPAPVSHRRYMGSALEPMYASMKYEMSDPSWSMPTLLVAVGVTAGDTAKDCSRFSESGDLTGDGATLADLNFRSRRSACRVARAAGSWAL